HRRIKHHSHGDCSKDRTSCHHDRHKDNSLWKTFTWIFYFIDIRRNFLASAYRKDQNGKACEVTHIKIRNQIIQTEIQTDKICARVNRRCSEHHYDVQKGHDKHAGSGNRCQLLQWIKTSAGNIAADQKYCQCRKLYINRRNRIIGLMITENRPAQRFKPAASLAGNVSDVTCPVRPSCIISDLRSCCLIDPGIDTASAVLESGAQFSDHQGIRNKVQGKHQYPAEHYLRSVKIDK